MTDRELLEQAAKAAGPEIFGEPGCYFRSLSENHSLVSGWNPLIDDGDALRLAVKLKLLIDASDGFSQVCDSEGVCIAHDHEHYSDPYAATRRAIVRAAATIGKGMK